MAETPACPRCGYDQRGVIDSWTQSCPLGGICSECGLKFEWSDLLGVRSERLAGFFEHATGFRRSLWWAWRTWLWAIIPNRFWSRVRMHHRIAPRRIWLWPVVILMSLHAIGAFAETFAIWSSVLFRGGKYNNQAWFDSIRTLVKPLMDVLPWADYLFEEFWNSAYGQWNFIDWPHGLTVGVGVGLVCAFVFALLGDTRRIYKVRLAHTVRVSLYGFAWIVPVAAIYTICRVALAIDFMLVIDTFRESPGFDYYTGGVFWRIADLIRSGARVTEDLLLVVVLAWIAWWWWVALTKGLEIHEAGRIWCVLMVTSALSTSIILALIYAARVHLSTSWW